VIGLMPKKRSSRIYMRTRGGETRYYADFRDYSDVGGRREALIAPGEKSATTDEDVAAELVCDRVRYRPLARMVTHDKAPARISLQGLCFLQWAWVESNYRPHAYQACALTT
jgi:hypothetical protein